MQGFMEEASQSELEEMELDANADFSDGDFWVTGF